MKQITRNGGRSSDRRGELTRSVALVDVVMLGAGSALGHSIFSVLGPAAAIGGSGILIAVGVSALPMAVFAIVYAFLASAAPRSGASFQWPYEFISPFAGYMLSWLRIFGQVGQITTTAFVFVRYVGLAVPLPPTLTMFAMFACISALNYVGIEIAARAQTILMLMLTSILILYVVTGAPHVQFYRIIPILPHGIWPVLLATPLMINLFMGIEASTEIGEEVRDPHRNVPLAIAASLFLILTVYVAVTFVTLGLIGPAATAASPAPLLDAAKTSALATVATPLILGAAALSLTKSLNASFMLFSRSLFAMGRAGVLPRILGRPSGPRATPRAAVVAAFFCACTGLLLPRTLVFLFLASNVPLILKYLSTCVCSINVARGRPEVFATARLRLPRKAVLGFAFLGAALALGLFALGLQTDWLPYALIGAWGGIGALYWKLSGSSREPRAPVFIQSS